MLNETQREYQHNCTDACTGRHICNNCKDTGIVYVLRANGCFEGERCVNGCDLNAAPTPLSDEGLRIVRKFEHRIAALYDRLGRDERERQLEEFAKAALTGLAARKAGIAEPIAQTAMELAEAMLEVWEERT